MEKLPVYSEIKWFPTEGRYGFSRESYTLLSDDNKQCTKFVSCRDYIADLVYDMITGNNRNIGHVLGEYIHGKSPMMCLNKLKICISFPAANHAQQIEKMGLKNFTNALGFWIRKTLRQVEEDFDISQKTEVFTIAPDNLFTTPVKSILFVIEASPDWFISLPMLSLFTMMIRISLNTSSLQGVGYFEKDYKSLIIATIEDFRDTCGYFNHSGYLLGNNRAKTRLNASLIDLIDEIKKVGYKNIFYKYRKRNYPKDLSYFSIHKDLGILSFFSKRTIEKMPYWYRKISDNLINSNIYE